DAPCHHDGGARPRATLSPVESKHLVTLANRKQFHAAAGVSLLDAARDAGLALEHGCRTGRCGSCRTQVLAGTTKPLGIDLYLDEAQRAAGWVLSCVAEAASDLQLDTEDLGELAGIAVKTLPARIKTLARPAPEVLQMTLRLPPNNGFCYLAGQYINLIAPGGARRSYSLANAPTADGELELHIKRVDGGLMSTQLFEQAAAEQLLRFEGPRGSFFLRDVTGRDLVFLATGTGIAPIKAMLEALSQRPAEQQARSVHLLWGGRQPADLYWTPGSYSFALRYTPVLSRADASWIGARGHVQQVLLADAPNLAEAAVYACGSLAMVDDARAACIAAGLAPKQFHADAFVSA
ncbi:MAG TPA: 2Fe-2S iron-sulfur cluster-binding protein, partial [Burkholderiaceae bacterium]